MITETFGKESVQSYIDRMGEYFKDAELLLSGYQVVAQEIELPSNGRILRSLDQTIDFLNNLK